MSTTAIRRVRTTPAGYEEYHASATGPVPAPKPPTLEEDMDAMSEVVFGGEYEFVS